MRYDIYFVLITAEPVVNLLLFLLLIIGVISIISQVFQCTYEFNNFKNNVYIFTSFVNTRNLKFQTTEIFFL